MSRDIKESDWKHFRKLHAIALNRHCEQTLGEVQALTNDTRKTPHERYLAVYRLIERRDKELGRAFNDMRRSTAVIQLSIIVSYGLLTDEELADFSPELRSTLEMLSDL